MNIVIEGGYKEPFISIASFELETPGPRKNFLFTVEPLAIYKTIQHIVSRNKNIYIYINP